MTTSGTNLFNPDLSEIIEEAYERIGKEIRTGYEFKTARRSMNYLLTSWANQGINLWTVASGDITLIQGQATYNLPADCVDIIEHVIRQNPGSLSGQVDIVIPRIALPTYAAIPNKLTQGRPIQVYVDRQSPIPTINIWQTPNSASYTFHYWYLRRLDDAGTAGNVTQDIPFRFYEALTAGLAYMLAQKQAELDVNRIQMLKIAYDEAMQNAKDEDRDKAPVRFIPKVGSW